MCCAELQAGSPRQCAHNQTALLRPFSPNSKRSEMKKAFIELLLPRMVGV